jgi:hypothetical protein
MKDKTKLKEGFAIELVWFPVVVTVRGDLATYDEPGDSIVRVTYLDEFGDEPKKRHPGWLSTKAPLTVEPDKDVLIACGSIVRDQVDGRTKTVIGRPRRAVQPDPKSERRGYRWTPHAAVSFVVFVHGRFPSGRLTPAPPFHPPYRAPFADVRGAGV